MAEKKALVLVAPALSLNGGGEVLDKLKKKAVLLPNAKAEGLDALLKGMGGVAVATGGLEAACATEDALLLLSGGEAELAAALEAADRRTLLVVVTGGGVALHGLGMDSKAGSVDRAVNAQDVAVTIATVVDLPVDNTCTGGIIYQAMKNPNLKLDEIKKLKEALIRMESVIQRDNREPWEKHDCA